MLDRLRLEILFLIVLLLIPGFSQAAVRLESPDKVARGDAFLARGISDEPLEELTFYWRGKKYPIKTARVNGQSEALVLLPAPLDEKSQQLRLGLGQTTEAVHTDIALYNKSRPVQKLTVDKKYVKPPQKELKRIEADREKVRRALAVSDSGRKWSLPLQRPVAGGVSSEFGMKRVFNGEPRSVHRGLDLRGPMGTPIHSVAAGKVVLVDNLYYSGNTVYVDHGDGVFSAYLHMSEPRVTVGQEIGKGEVVGLVGATGRVTGPHLHLSMICQGQAVDPYPLLEKTAQGNEQKR